MSERKRTATSDFGVGRREAHDATGFYVRFEAPEILADSDVPTPQVVANPFVCGDARKMDEIEDGSVALVVTSPPYFAGKQYELELDREGVPSSYLEYLDLLRSVFAECKRKLEPGGRIAVNVANLGRKPYRSLSADVIRILQDDLRLLLRGEVIWRKGKGASGSCAWGSFRSAANPVLRDVTERVIIASKGRFDRALSIKQREAHGLPHESSLSSDEFMAATLDVWDIQPESAQRVNHPAPFPTELPERLIRLYTFADDLVLDPFMGSGSTLVAAARLGRRFIGYDLDANYVEIARARVQALSSKSENAHSRTKPRPSTRIEDEAEQFHDQASEVGKTVHAIAESVLSDAGFTVTERDVRLRKLGVSVSFVAEDARGAPWYFDVSGAFTTAKTGLYRAESVWECLGRAAILFDAHKVPVIFLTSHLPQHGSDGDFALRAGGKRTVFDAIEILSEQGRARLAAYAAGEHIQTPLPGYWTPEEIAEKPV